MQLNTSDLISCEIEATLEILFPEQTFRPRPLGVTLVEVSHAGARVRCPRPSFEPLKESLSTVRFARIAVRDDDSEARVYGKIIWIGEREPEYIQIGICYDGQEIKETEQRLNLVDIARRHEKRRAPARHQPPAPLPSSWLAALSMAPRSVEKARPTTDNGNSASGGAEMRRTERIPCRFCAQFQFNMGVVDLDDKIFKAFVVDVSWAGVRLRFIGDDCRTVFSSLRTHGITPISLTREGMGWLTVAQQFQKLSASVRIVWFGNEYQKLEGEWAIDMGLSIVGDESETRLIRSTLVQLAEAHPVPVGV